MALSINHNLMAMNTARNLNSAYGNIATSTRRLSSGLRVGTAADDAAGLAIREMMRADISSINQGVRNANDAISMIQVADGALQVVDEKLIRMKELATQAATGTYTSDQRLIINSEFQAMASEINRISEATNFNGIRLLSDATGLEKGLLLKYSFNGTLNDGSGNGSPVTIADAKYAPGIGGKDSIVFDGTNNDLTANFGMNKSSFTFSLWVKMNQQHPEPSQIFSSSAPATNLRYEMQVLNDGTLQTYHTNNIRTPLQTGPGVINVGEWHLITNTYDNGDYKVYVDGNNVISDNTGSGPVIFDSPIYVGWDPWLGVANYEKFLGQAQDFRVYDKALSADDVKSYYEGVVDGYNFTDGNLKIHFGSGNSSAEDYYYVNRCNVPATLGLNDFDVRTQGDAQNSLVGLNKSILAKDKIRASLGATQNRLSNTIQNLQIQGENLQAAESRISDVDVAQEMTSMVSNQILAQSATAMLAQANSLPKMALQLIQG